MKFTPSIRAEYLSFINYSEISGGWSLSFKYDKEGLRDLFPKKDISDKTYVSDIYISVDFNLDTQTVDDYASVTAETANADIEYEFALSDMEKLYVKEELIARGMI